MTGAHCCRGTTRDTCSHQQLVLYTRSNIIYNKTCSQCCLVTGAHCCRVEAWHCCWGALVQEGGPGVHTSLDTCLHPPPGRGCVGVDWGTQDQDGTWCRCWGGGGQVAVLEAGCQTQRWRQQTVAEAGAAVAGLVEAGLMVAGLVEA